MIFQQYSTVLKRERKRENQNEWYDGFGLRDVNGNPLIHKQLCMLWEKKNPRNPKINTTSSSLSSLSSLLIVENCGYNKFIHIQFINILRCRGFRQINKSNNVDYYNWASINSLMIVGISWIMFIIFHCLPISLSFKVDLYSSDLLLTMNFPLHSWWMINALSSPMIFGL